MKKNLACILAVILCCCAACAAAETAFVIPRPSYEDGTGVSFVFPEGWLIERPDWEDRTFPFSQVLKPVNRDPLVSLIYHPVDIWPVLAPYLGTMGFAREDIGNGTVYRVFEFLESSGLGTQVSYTTAVTIRNGYIFYFALGTPGEPDAYLPDFAGWLDSVAFEK